MCKWLTFRGNILLFCLINIIQDGKDDLFAFEKNGNVDDDLDLMDNDSIVGTGWPIMYLEHFVVL